MSYANCLPGYEKERDEINNIISIIRIRLRHVTSDAVLYLGDNQYRALMTIAHDDLMAMRDDKFRGFPVVRVLKDDWCRLA